MDGKHLTGRARMARFGLLFIGKDADGKDKYSFPHAHQNCKHCRQRGSSRDCYFWYLDDEADLSNGCVPCRLRRIRCEYRRQDLGQDGNIISTGMTFHPRTVAASIPIDGPSFGMFTPPNTQYGFNRVGNTIPTSSSSLVHTPIRPGSQIYVPFGYAIGSGPRTPSFSQQPPSGNQLSPYHTLPNTPTTPNIARFQHSMGSPASIPSSPAPTHSPISLTHPVNPTTPFSLSRDPLLPRQSYRILGVYPGGLLKIEPREIEVRSNQTLSSPTRSERSDRHVEFRDTNIPPSGYSHRQQSNSHSQPIFSALPPIGEILSFEQMRTPSFPAESLQVNALPPAEPHIKLVAKPGGSHDNIAHNNDDRVDGIHDGCTTCRQSKLRCRFPDNTDDDKKSCKRCQDNNLDCTNDLAESTTSATASIGIQPPKQGTTASPDHRVNGYHTTIPGNDEDIRKTAVRPMVYITITSCLECERQGRDCENPNPPGSGSQSCKWCLRIKRTCSLVQGDVSRKRIAFRKREPGISTTPQPQTTSGVVPADSTHSPTPPATSLLKRKAPESPTSIVNAELPKTSNFSQMLSPQSSYPMTVHAERSPPAAPIHPRLPSSREIQPSEILAHSNKPIHMTTKSSVIPTRNRILEDPQAPRLLVPISLDQRISSRPSRSAGLEQYKFVSARVDPYPFTASTARSVEPFPRDVSPPHPPQSSAMTTTFSAAMVPKPVATRTLGGVAVDGKESLALIEGLGTAEHPFEIDLRTPEPPPHH